MTVHDVYSRHLVINRSTVSPQTLIMVKDLRAGGTCKDMDQALRVSNWSCLELGLFEDPCIISRAMLAPEIALTQLLRMCIIYKNTPGDTAELGRGEYGNWGVLGI